MYLTGESETFISNTLLKFLQVKKYLFLYLLTHIKPRFSPSHFIALQREIERATLQKEHTMGCAHDSKQSDLLYETLCILEPLIAYGMWGSSQQVDTLHQLCSYEGIQSIQHGD